MRAKPSWATDEPSWATDDGRLRPSQAC
jgi:hypothetical protein